MPQDPSGFLDGERTAIPKTGSDCPFMNTAKGFNKDVSLTGGLGLRVWHLNLDLAAGATPNTTRLQSNGKKIPSRANFSGTLSFSKVF